MRPPRGPALMLGLTCLLSACQLDSPATDGGTGTDDTDTETESARYHPPVGVRWQWQLSGTVNTGYDVALYDIDLFDASGDDIDTLHASGRRVICYFSAGSFENWRPDAGEFDAALLGNTLDGWADERWLDVRNPQLQPIMAARLDLARDKGCDGVEPDNVDGYSNDSGFPIQAAHQLDYNRFLADAAHDRGLAVALKNDLDQIDALVGDFDFAVNEECFAYDECDALTPFIEAGKPVLNVEYDLALATNATARDDLCQRANARGFSTLILPLDLDDSFRFDCADSP